MKIVFDLEANSLKDPSKIWCIVCKDIDTDKKYIFRNLTTDKEENEKFLKFANGVHLWIGHNVLDYDVRVIKSLLNLVVKTDDVLDTLIISKLIDYPRDGHSVEDYGLEFNYPKIKFSDFSSYSKEMEEYCERDVDICHKIYLKYKRQINDPEWQPSIKLEHKFQTIVNSLHENGFAFNTSKATKLLEKVKSELNVLDKDILKEFPPKEKLIREFTPRATRYGTISKQSVPKVLWDKISEYEIGKTYKHTKFEDFNPSSHKQVIEILNEAGWEPVNKTTTHINVLRELGKLKRTKQRSKELDLALQECYAKLSKLEKTGWKIDEINLNTLPLTAPSPARTLAKRILLEARRRTLTEWLGLVQPDTNRIHGKFYGIGAWTHRMAHQSPNTANIPNEFDTEGKVKLYGKEMRALWQAPKNRLLVGVDAEGIQLRIFAHYINDPEFTEALVNGKKEDKSDPHSLNQRILGDACKTRAAAKRFIYALLLGAGLPKLSSILAASSEETERALTRLLERYKGFAYLKSEIIPADAKRGWFRGLDGRAVKIPGESLGQRKHLCMSGYLQNGEAVVMKLAACKWADNLKKLDAKLVNFVHDEWQTECPNNVEIALKIARMQADSLKEVGEELKLNCPLAGSYWNDDLKDYTIGTNWKVTH